MSINPDSGVGKPVFLSFKDATRTLNAAKPKDAPGAPPSKTDRVTIDQLRSLFGGEYDSTARTLVENFDKLDRSKDGKLSYGELKNAAKRDGDSSNITAGDINAPLKSISSPKPPKPKTGLNPI